MGFQIIDQGTRFPLTAGMFTTPPRRVERLQHTAKDKRIEENKDNLQEREQRENKKQKPRSSSTLIYQKTEYPHQRNSLHANQIMSSPVVTILPDTRLDEAWEIIREHRFRHLPILTPNKKVAGIISDRDLLREAAQSEASGDKQPVNTPAQKWYEADAHYTDAGFYHDNIYTFPKKKTVLDICKTRILTATPDTELREIAKILIEEHIGSMPIVDENNHLLGIITRSDILRTIVANGAIDLLI
ncbi:MAG: hypothetical protein CV080_05975 [Candidatus Kuenenia stuttgartiensis]|nr:MAG: hypothetical protein CV080_05975 [Candidatus Kuenenia stuttgartiensis]